MSLRMEQNEAIAGVGIASLAMTVINVAWLLSPVQFCGFADKMKCTPCPRYVITRAIASRGRTHRAHILLASLS
jgi:hypothetical protein